MVETKVIHDSTQSSIVHVFDSYQSVIKTITTQSGCINCFTNGLLKRCAKEGDVFNIHRTVFTILNISSYGIIIIILICL